MRKTVSLLLLLMFGGAGVLAPQDPQAAQAPVPVGNLLLQGASLEQVIDQLARQLQINYLVDAPIEGTVTLNTYGDPGMIDARNLLELLLRINGLGMVQEGEIYRIVELNQMRRLPIQRVADPNQILPDDRMMLNLVFLKYMTVDTLSTLLAEFTDDRTIIRSYAPANLLMILANRRNMRSLMELVAEFDSETFAGERVRLFQIENLLPSELQKELEGVLRSLSLDGQTATVRFLPVDRIGLLIAVAPNPGVFDTVAQWVDRLDTPITFTSAVIDTYVYRVRYGRADCLALALNQIYNPYANPYGGMGGGFGGNFAGGGFAPQTPYAGFGGGYGPYGAWATGGYGGGFGGPSASGYGSGNSFNNAFGGSSPCGPYGGGFGSGGGFGGAFPPAFGGYAAQIPINTQAAPGGLVGAGQPAPAAAPAGSGLAANGQPAATGAAQIAPPRIVPNPLDNALLIQGTREQYQAILKLLRDLDIPPRQILLEAKIYSVTLNNAFSTGINAYFQQRTGGPGTDRRPIASLVNGLAVLEAGMLVSQSRELLAAVSLQEIAGNAQVISEPSLIATDSIPATINVGTQVPVLTGQTASPIQQGGTNAFTQGISSHNTGVTLQVNARVNPSGVVTLIVNQEVSSPQETTTSSIPTPSFNQQVVQTQITLQDGDTIAIGGTITDNTSNSSVGIPGLNRIPILGHLFGSKSFSRDRSELIIFMTPHVIYDTTDLLEASEEVKSRMRRLQRYLP